jgi:cytoplasmic iron level regulating protein YaaA (DUF328/UPF0246 family)
MLVLLPPSETKVSGGEPGTKLNLDRLSFTVQNTLRASLLEQLSHLAEDESASFVALKLGPHGGPEVLRNRELMYSPVMPALWRYTGVLYDALAPHTLDDAAVLWAEEHVAVFSALFGLIKARDLIPAYRLSWDSKLPGGALSSQWAAIQDALWAEVDGFVLDLRSEGYRQLAPLPPGRGVFVSLVGDGPRGARKALGHANKSAKGALLKALAASGAIFSCVEEVVFWGDRHGYTFDAQSGKNDTIDLVFSGT